VVWGAVGRRQRETNGRQVVAIYNKS